MNLIELNIRQVKTFLQFAEISGDKKDIAKYKHQLAELTNKLRIQKIDEILR